MKRSSSKKVAKAVPKKAAKTPAKRPLKPRATAGTKAGPKSSARRPASTKPAAKKPAAKKPAAKTPTVKKPVPKKPAAQKPARPVAKKAATRPATAQAPGPAAPEVPRNPLGIRELHVTFNARDLGGLLSFFRDNLGFTSDSQGGRPGTYQWDAQMEYLSVSMNSGASLGFWSWDRASEMAMQQRGPVPEEPPVGGLYLVCDDVDRVYETLSKRGVTFAGPPMHTPWGHRIVRTKDPEGRSITFAQGQGG